MDTQTRAFSGVIGAILLSGAMVSFELGGKLDVLPVFLCAGIAFLLPFTWHFLSTVAAPIGRFLAGHAIDHPGSEQAAKADSDPVK